MWKFFASVAVAAACVVAATPARASDVTNDKLAFLTFNAPVQVPGVTLNAGTYRFRLTNPGTRRDVLQVLSNDGTTVYAMFHTINDSRSTLTSEAMVTFRETPAGVPPAVRSLFYGGEHRGYEFVYPKGGPIMIAETVPQPEITYTSHPAPPVEPVLEPELAPAEPVVVAEAEPAPEPQPEPVELPRTASPLPLVATGGALSLLAGLSLSLLRRRTG